MANLPSVKDDTFETEVLKSGAPVLVDFSATWCGPCRALAPILEGLAKDYTGKVKFVTVDIDEARDTAIRFGIMSVPTMILFKDGGVVKTLTGVTSRVREDVVNMLGSVL